MSAPTATPTTDFVFSTANAAHQAALLALGEANDAGAPLLGDVAAADRATQIVERLRRLASVAVVDTMQAIDDARVFVDQGHSSARAMVAHLADLSSSDAFRMDRIRRMVHSGRADLIAQSWTAGSLGIEQAVLLAKVYANPRVRDRFVEDQAWFLNQARKHSWKRFEQKIARWLELVDDPLLTGLAPPVIVRIRRRMPIPRGVRGLHRRRIRTRLGTGPRTPWRCRHPRAPRPDRCTAPG